MALVSFGCTDIFQKASSLKTISLITFPLPSIRYKRSVSGSEIIILFSTVWIISSLDPDTLSICFHEMPRLWDINACVSLIATSIFDSPFSNKWRWVGLD